ncbi:alpha-L-fucosidase, partial [Dysgonomonas sp. UBA7698]
YKSAKTVIHMLIDIISKNGNLLLSIPQRGNGTIDDKELKILEDIAAWMAVNSDGVYGTRPWKVFGEGPVAEAPNPIQAQGFNEGKHQPYTSEDIRFVTKGDVLYAHVLAWPENGKVVIKSLSDGNSLYPKTIHNIQMVGNDGKIKYSRTKEGLVVELPENSDKKAISILLKII